MVKKVVFEYRHMTVQELSIKMGYNSPSALYNRFKRDNFSESDLQEVCKILNCSYDVTIKMNDIGKEGKAAGQGGSKETIDL